MMSKEAGLFVSTGLQNNSGISSFKSMVSHYLGCIIKAAVSRQYTASLSVVRLRQSSRLPCILKQIRSEPSPSVTTKGLVWRRAAL